MLHDDFIVYDLIRISLLKHGSCLHRGSWFAATRLLQNSQAKENLYCRSSVHFAYRVRKSCNLNLSQPTEMQPVET